MAVTLDDIITRSIAYGADMLSRARPVDVEGLQRLLGAPGQGGVFGELDPKDLLGLLPDQVMDVAKTRSQQEYQKMLTDLGALSFVKEATGLKAAENLAADVIGDAIRSRANKELARVTAMYQDPLRQRAHDLLKGIGAKRFKWEDLSPADQALIRKYTAPQINPETAVEILSQFGARERYMREAVQRGETPDLKLLEILFPLSSPELVDLARETLGLKEIPEKAPATPQRRAYTRSDKEKWKAHERKRLAREFAKRGLTDSEIDRLLERAWLDKIRLEGATYYGGETKR